MPCLRQDSVCSSHLMNCPMNLPPEKPGTAQSSPRRQAVAIAYGARDAAPRVVAKGFGVTADAIIARAKQAGIFVHESEGLVDLLMQVDLDDHIPPQLYMAVAEVLAWVYRAGQGELPAQPSPSQPAKQR